MSIARHNSQEFPEVIYEMDVFTADDEPVTFSRRLRNAQVRVEGHLSLGQHNREFEISDAELSCKLLTIQAQRFFVRSTTRADIVQIQAETFNVAASSIGTIKKAGEGTFIISWPNSNTFPWHEHSGIIQTRVENKSELIHALRRILSWFRRDRREEFAKLAEFIDNVAIGSDPVRKGLLEFLMLQQIIYRKDFLYVYDPVRARSSGLNWADLRRSNLTDTIAAFFGNFQDYYNSKNR